MRLSRSTILALVASLTTAGSLMAQKVNTDFNKKADFSHCKTYMWVHDPDVQNPLMQQRLIDDIDAQLNAKGWQMVTENADVAITANGATKDQQTLESFYTGFPGWRWSWDTTATTNVEHFTVGTLVVTLFDARSKQAIFRGISSGTPSDKPEKNAEKLNKAVEKMFKNFPPNLKD